MTKVLVTGLPRSGTTWIGRSLGRTEGAAYLHEPDQEKDHAFALRAKRSLGRFPLMSVDDKGHGEFESLWRAAFSPPPEKGRIESRTTRLRRRGAIRLLKSAPEAELEAALHPVSPHLNMRLRAVTALALPRHCSSTHVVVKSVHSALCVEWIVARVQAQVVVVFRHPLNTISSWLSMTMPDQDRGLDGIPGIIHLCESLGIALPARQVTALTRAAWQWGLLTCALQDATERNPQWVAVHHDELCMDPRLHFEALSRKLGLEWGDSADAFLRDSERPGDRYATKRVAREQPRRWASRLTRGDVDEIKKTLAGFPLRGWPHEDAPPKGASTSSTKAAQR